MIAPELKPGPSVLFCIKIVIAHVNDVTKKLLQLIVYSTALTVWRFPCILNHLILPVRQTSVNWGGNSFYFRGFLLILNEFLPKRAQSFAWHSKHHGVQVDIYHHHHMNKGRQVTFQDHTINNDDRTGI